MLRWLFTVVKTINIAIVAKILNSIACKNRPLIFDSRKNKFVFKDENIFGTKDDAVNELTKRNMKK